MISIIIPIKNQYSIVKKCIESVIRHYKDEEVILVDDCSREQELIDYLYKVREDYNWS